MMLANEVSRFHVAKMAIMGAAKWNEKVQVRQHELCSELNHNIAETQKYIVEKRKDPDDTYTMPAFD
ncbi:hypothetical protein ARAM_006096 [Aspergillus rambellii]|uniref:Xylulose 5-phosphate/Fructose 6-phosphate phosphoketolase C-terminal domain-containing protein n=2 Tax=Aspergillus subgen. Nidulantes TaxID=2720870 RepID=A0A0F8UYV7_9EURO|nr:hypothetical protein ARAM_006096 [Aspergillus rambellii]